MVIWKVQLANGESPIQIANGTGGLLPGSALVDHQARDDLLQPCGSMGVWEKPGALSHYMLAPKLPYAHTSLHNQAEMP